MNRYNTFGVFPLNLINYIAPKYFNPIKTAVSFTRDFSSDISTTYNFKTQLVKYSKIICIYPRLFFPHQLIIGIF